MFIDPERHPKTKAPEEGNVVGASATFRSLGAAKTRWRPANYKHFVPPGLSVMVRNFVTKTRNFGLVTQRTQRGHRELSN